MQAQMQLAHFAGDYILNLLRATEEPDCEPEDVDDEVSEPAATAEG
ncbi:MAG: hypothetical protein ACR2QO_16890 [Acidimicrobiales bacterium]